MSRIMQPGEIEKPLEDIPHLRLPDPADLFAARARRLEQLAPGHALSDFLAFAARIGVAQQAALDVFPAVPLPSAEQLSAFREHGLPALGTRAWQRDPAWREALIDIVEALEPEANEATRAILSGIESAEVGWLESQATLLLAAEYEAVDRGAAPFLGAALQVYWTAMASRLGEAAFGRIATPARCPVCGSHPGASVVQAGQGLRYLCCSLCSTRWHLVRVKCAGCDSAEDLSYRGRSEGPEAVKLESCGSCDGYLKIFYLDKDAAADPVADDLATLTLDLALADEGMLKIGTNLLLIPGES